MVRARSTSRSLIELNMTPMIDVVFQLLTFFLMTFRVAAVEGDFNLRLPPPSQTDRFDSARRRGEQMVVRLRADDRGDLAAIQLDARSLPTGPTVFERLRTEFLRHAETAAAADQTLATLEIDADDGLHYAYVVRTIAAASPRFDGRGEPRPLFLNVRFAPR